MILRWFFLFTTVLLSACTPTVSNETNFNNQSSKAIVVIGFGCVYADTNCEAWISPIKEDGSILQFGTPILVKNTQGIFSTTKEDTTTGLVVYSSYVVNPGEYVFTEFSAFTHPRRRNTLLYKDKKYLIKFTAEAGKINYIGDFSIFAKTFPAKLLSHNYNTEAAQNFMKQFPNVSGEFQRTKIINTNINN